MVKERPIRQIWYYGVSWVSEVVSITHSSVDSVNGEILLINVTNKTVDISKYIYFGFYDKLWFKDNDGISPSEPGKCLWISHYTWGLMYYHILTQTGKVIFISTA